MPKTCRTSTDSSRHHLRLIEHVRDTSIDDAHIVRKMTRDEMKYLHLAHALAEHSQAATANENPVLNLHETVANENLAPDLKESAHNVWLNRDKLPEAFAVLREDAVWKMLFPLFEHLTDAFLPPVMDETKRQKEKDLFAKAILTMWYVYNQTKKSLLKTNPEARKYFMHDTYSLVLPHLQENTGQKLRSVLHEEKLTTQIKAQLNALSTATIEACANEIGNTIEEQELLQRYLAIARSLIAEANTSLA